MTQAALPILSFDTQQEWRKWLEKNHASSDGIWLKFAKKGSDNISITYAQALDEALCYGWIDSQAKSHDEKSYLQRFGPRRTKSVWSKINTGHIDRLMKAGKMKPAGIKVVEEAKADGRWSAAYHPPSTMTVPEDFLKELAKNKKAQAFFETLNKTNRYAIAWRIQTAKKPETRTKRITTIIEMLEKGEKFH
jgi:uncharacterized protein YdeI (YjbR/CyaY-like superfamily)